MPKFPFEYSEVPIAMPIVTSMLDHAAKEIAVYYTPGHKGGRALSEQFRQGFLTQPLSFDIGFMGHFDDLHAPCGIIAEAERAAASLFGAENSYFLTNGSSGGLIALLLAALSPGDEVLLPRNVHRSVLYGLVLGDFVPRFVDTGYEAGTGLVLPLAESCLTNEIVNSAKAVFPMSPTYHGLAADVGALAARVRKHGAWVFVDEAHGAHAAFDPRLPQPALACGAHAVVQSTHKTLQAFTPGAMLHRAMDGPDPARIRAALRMMQSSSANYGLLASLDASRAYMEVEGRKRLAEAIDALVPLRYRLNATGLVVAHDPGRNRPPGVSAIDPTKLILDFRCLGLSGHSAAEMLYRESGIAAELATEEVVLLIVTAADTSDDLDRLGDILAAFAQNHEGRHPPPEPHPGLPVIAGGRVISPREAFFASSEPISVADALGRVAAETVVPYPPGVAAIWPGETIEGDLVAFREAVVRSGASIQSSDPNLATILVIK